jgi:hypothetical protein
MTNMNVSVTLRFIDQFTSNVRSFQQQLQGLTRGIEQINRVAGGVGSSSPFGRMQGQIRGLSSEVRSLAGQFSQLGRAMSAPSGGAFGQRQIADMRQMIQLQQQIIANNNRMMAGPGGPRGPRAPGSGAVLGRPGFNPNASLIDRAQFGAVNLGQRSLIEGAIDLDLARTQLRMLAMPRRDPNGSNTLLPGTIRPEIVAQIEREAVDLMQQFRALNCVHVLARSASWSRTSRTRAPMRPQPFSCCRRCSPSRSGKSCRATPSSRLAKGC